MFPTDIYIRRKYFFYKKDEINFHLSYIMLIFVSTKKI